MSWFEPINLYCERTSSSFWAEPVNALTNIAFLVAAAAAFVLWRRSEGRDLLTAGLIAVTALVGIGSFAFHTLATRGAVLLDVIPIALFVYLYLYLALRRFLNLRLGVTVSILAAFIVFSRALSWVVPPNFPNGSHEYLPPLAALIIVGLLVKTNHIRRSIHLAAAVFLISLALRTIDKAVCSGFPIGTHFVWHVLNAVVLYILLRTAVLAAKESGLRHIRGA
jgi:hypothetical protein